MAEILYVDWDGLIYYDGKIKDYIRDEIRECLKFKGNVTYQEMLELSPSFDTLNYAFRVTEDFITNEWFSTPGLMCKAGTIIVVALQEDSTYKYDLLIEPTSGNVDIDTSELATKEELSKVVESLPDVVLFTNDEVVTNPLGGFAYGDPVSGMSLKSILATLLGIEMSDNPTPPEETETVVESIVNNEIPMYSIDEDGKLSETAFKLLTYTVAESQKAPKESGFYQIVDASGNVIESGYQEITVVNLDGPYIIALPKDVDYNDMITVQVFDTAENKWCPTEIEMTNDYNAIVEICEELDGARDISDFPINTHTLWADLEKGSTGSMLRFIINE